MLRLSVKATLSSAGRSMIEMLGVLAIVALLTLSAFWGIRYFRVRQEANELAFACTRLTQDMLTVENRSHWQEGALIEESESIEVFALSSEAFVLSPPPVSSGVCRILLPLLQNDYRIWVNDALWNGDEAACAFEPVEILLEKTLSGTWDALAPCADDKVALFAGGCGCPADRPLAVDGTCQATCPAGQKAGNNGLCCEELNEDGACCESFTFTGTVVSICCEKGETAYANAFCGTACCPPSSVLTQIQSNCWGTALSACCPSGFQPFIQSCTQTKCCADQHFYDLDKSVVINVCCADGYVGYSSGYNGFCCPVHQNYHLDTVIPLEGSQNCWNTDLKTCCPDGYQGYVVDSEETYCSREKRCCPVENLTEAGCSGGDIASYEGVSNGHLING